jgi:hypothetical protein
LTGRSTDWADVMGVDRPTAHIIANRGTELATDQLWKAHEDASSCGERSSASKGAVPNPVRQQLMSSV